MSDLARARAAELLALLSDPVRLGILAAAQRHGTDGASLAELSEESGAPLRTVGEAASRLVALGVMDRVNQRYAARLDGLRQAADALDEIHPITALLADYPRLRGVFSHGRIVGMPVLAVHGADLAEMLGRFIDLDGPCDETEINKRLAAVGDDVALLRRLMVDEGVLIRDRAGTTYSPVAA